MDRPPLRDGGVAGGDWLARVCPGQSADRVSARGIRSVPADADRNSGGDGAGALPAPDTVRRAADASPGGGDPRAASRAHAALRTVRCGAARAGRGGKCGRGAAARGAARHGRRPAKAGSQRSVLVRKRKEVQEVPRQRRVAESPQSSLSSQSSLSTDSTQFRLGRPGRLGRLGRPALAVLSGLFLILSFPPFDAGWLAWVALTPLVLAVHGRPMRHAFGLGYLAGGVAFAGILAWIRVFGLLPWVLLSAYLALYPAAFAVVTHWCATGRPAWRWVWLAAIAWMGLEYLRSTGVFGFPWALLGLTQHRLLPVLQVARYTGVYGVSLLVALTGTSLAGVVLVRRPAPVIFPAIVLVLATGWRVQQAHALPPGPIVTAAVQPDVSQAQEFDPGPSGGHMEALRRLVENAGRRGAELIVLPETAVPLNLFGPGGALVEVGRWAQQARATVIASSLENGVSNAAVAVAPSGKAVSRYDKVRLVAFGETGIVPGTSHEPLRTPLGRGGVGLCFESIFPAVTPAPVRNRAQILTVITNDAWLDGTAGPAQHAVHSVLRAVESGRWVVRAANTGPSMVIDPVGRVRATISPRQSTILTSHTGLVDAPTAYAIRGDVFVWSRSEEHTSELQSQSNLVYGPLLEKKKKQTN